MSYTPEEYWPKRHEKQGDSYVAPGGKEALSGPQVEALVPYFDHLPSEGRVLDYGCGPGRFRPYLEQRGLEYEGVDLIPWLGTIDVGEIEGGEFDCAVAIFVLQHIVDVRGYEAAVNDLHLALRPGGKLLVVDHDPGGRMYPHMHPRGSQAIWKIRPWAAYDSLGEWNGHWIGLFEK